MSKNPHIGESFESFLRDEGIRDEVVATATRRTLALESNRKRGRAENFKSGAGLACENGAD